MVFRFLFKSVKNVYFILLATVSTIVFINAMLFLPSLNNFLTSPLYIVLLFTNIILVIIVVTGSIALIRINIFPTWEECENRINNKLKEICSETYYGILEFYKWFGIYLSVIISLVISCFLDKKEIYDFFIIFIASLFIYFVFIKLTLSLSKHRKMPMTRIIDYLPNLIPSLICYLTIILIIFSTDKEILFFLKKIELSFNNIIILTLIQLGILIISIVFITSIDYYFIKYERKYK